jgi:hypothetical protein
MARGSKSAKARGGSGPERKDPPEQFSIQAVRTLIATAMSSIDEHDAKEGNTPDLDDAYEDLRQAMRMLTNP